MNFVVKTLRQNLKVPVSCKIRIFEDVSKTILYAKMLEEAGCQMLSVHGRTRDQKGRMTGLANWCQIKAVK
jgi:tRNA-dihydrouridine synthase 1